MTTNIQDSDGVKFITRDFKSDRNTAIAKAVFATAVIVMAVVAAYFLASATTQLFTSMAPIVEINAAVVTATIAYSVGVFAILFPLEIGMFSVVKAVKDVVKSNKLLKAVKEPDSSELKVICETRKYTFKKKVAEITAIREKLVSNAGSLEDLAYGEGCKFDNLDSSTCAERAEECNFTAHAILMENRQNFSHTIGQMIIIISAIAAIAAVYLAIPQGMPLPYLAQSLIMPITFTTIGVGLLFLPNRSWKKLTQLDQNEEYWKKELESEENRFNSLFSDKAFKRYQTDKKAYEELSGLLVAT